MYSSGVKDTCGHIGENYVIKNQVKGTIGNTSVSLTVETMNWGERKRQNGTNVSKLEENFSMGQKADRPWKPTANQRSRPGSRDQCRAGLGQEFKFPPQEKSAGNPGRFTRLLRRAWRRTHAHQSG